MEKKLDLRVRKTYNALVIAFEDLISEKEFDKITVNELCDRAAIRRPTFYKHFIDKYDFLNFFLKRKSEEVFRKTLKITSEDASPVEFFTNLFELVLDDSNLQYQILLKNTIDIDLIKELSSLKSFGHELVREQLKDQLDAEAIELDYLIFTILSLTLTSCIFWLDHQDKLSKTEMIDLYKTRIAALL